MEIEPGKEEKPHSLSLIGKGGAGGGVALPLHLAMGQKLVPYI